MPKQKVSVGELVENQVKKWASLSEEKKRKPEAATPERSSNSKRVNRPTGSLGRLSLFRKCSELVQNPAPPSSVCVSAGAGAEDAPATGPRGGAGKKGRTEMEGFTIVDGIVAGVIIVSAILAYSRGFVREVLAIGGWVVAAIVAFIFAPDVRPMISEIPYVGDFIGESCDLGIIAALAGVFVLALVLVSFFTPMFSGAIQRSAIGGVDAGLGFLFGVARGALLVVVALIAYDRLAGEERIVMVDDSRTALIFAQAQDRIEQQIPEDAPGWILARYEQLTATCVAEEEPTQTDA